MRAAISALRHVHVQMQRWMQNNEYGDHMPYRHTTYWVDCMAGVLGEVMSVPPCAANPSHIHDPAYASINRWPALEA